jgi:hypothetical protein
MFVSVREFVMASIQPPVSVATVTLPLSPEQEAERRAFNRAFRELGLSWYWEVYDYRELVSAGDASARVCRYVQTRQPALLAAYDADFIAKLVSDIAERIRSGQAQSTQSEAPGAARGWTPGAHSVDFVA